MNVCKCVDYVAGDFILVASNTKDEARIVLFNNGYKNRFTISFIPKLKYDGLIPCIITK